MPVRLTWLVPEKVIFCQLAGDLSLLDYDQYVAQVEYYVVQCSGAVHFVQDLRLVTRPTLNLADIRKFMRLVNKNTGWYLAFGRYDHALLGFLTGAAARILGVRMHPIFRDYASLRTFLLQLDSTLELPLEAPELFSEKDFLLTPDAVIQR